MQIKLISLSLFLIGAFVSCSSEEVSNVGKEETSIQSLSNEDSIRLLFNINDSIQWVMTDHENGAHTYVFLDYSHDSKYYEPWEKDYDLSSYDLAKVIDDYQKSILDSISFVSQVLNNKHLLGTWLELRQFNGEDVLPYTCEPHGELVLDSNFLYDLYYLDGPEVYVYESIDSISENHIFIKAQSILREEKLEFEILNLQNGKFITRWTRGKGKSFYNFRVKNVDVRNFPILVHECQDLWGSVEMDEVNAQLVFDSILSDTNSVDSLVY